MGCRYDTRLCIKMLTNISRIARRKFWLTAEHCAQRLAFSKPIQRLDSCRLAQAFTGLMYHPSMCNVLTVTMSLEHLMKLSISIVRASSSIVCFRVKFGAAFWVTALGLWLFGITVRKPKGDGVRSIQPYTASVLPRSSLKILPPILSWF